MKRTIRHILDFEKVKPYFIDHISSDTSLSKLFKKELNFNNGQFFIDLPEFCHLSRLYNFKSGGMTPKVDVGAEKAANVKSKTYTPRFFQSTDFETSQFILKYLKMNKNNFVVLNNINLLPSDKNINIDNVKMAFERQEVYYILKGSNTFEEIYKTFRSSCYSWHSFVVFSSGELIDSNHFILDNQDVISNNIHYILAGAYDGEGYIIWQKDIQAIPLSQSSLPVK